MSCVHLSCMFIPEIESLDLVHAGSEIVHAIEARVAFILLCHTREIENLHRLHAGIEIVHAIEA